MSRPKGKPKAVAKPSAPVETEQAARVTIINLKGTQEQVEWLEAAHRSTHIPKAVIVRLGLALWAEKNGLPAFPLEGRL